MHYRIQNSRLISQAGNRESHSILIICVYNDAESWGKNRTIVDFFNLIGSFNYPKEKISITLLTSSLQEFNMVKTLFATYIHQYPRLSLIFRNDFAQAGLTRMNRHNHALQAGRRRMLARYRNFALLSTMESWHQHVLWLDADIIAIPADLLPKVVQSGRDIQEPMCVRMRNGKLQNYDKNAWVGRPAQSAVIQRRELCTGSTECQIISQFTRQIQTICGIGFGGTMLYVRADIHRQGVMFPTNYVIGSEWGREGYDGIETEGLCYSAHFLGYKCWGMPNDVIQHV
ncbi:LOW QUALITY PROTEIN: hypothetical protein PHMEG_00041201 [Phytophthora megakarya]|uniref:Uncharacterized protein n=1 Tax=Phytophthora megakarya TaxID=4795 RepID=A0A225UCE8_9STRA|nr:LOW QUALITY PROTEIN: hypothetical protein PHMEG_00041201 [Phytophthora megakarya]